tara:strand:- start:2808 stop:7661 length:4854 start_codon:yes stop_codon:yes gene_type:complete
MAEFKLGRIRFIWKDAWSSGTVYLKDDVIRYGGRTYVAVTGHTSTSNFYDDLSNWNKFSDGTDWKADWTQSTFYKINDIVRYGGIIYICNTGHTAQSTLEADQSKWDQFATSIDWKDAWTTATQYKANDLVKYGGNVYLCNTGHTSAATATLGLETDILKWDIFSEGQDWKQNWAISTRYKVNDIVKYGGTLYVANTGHTSAATITLGLEDDQSKWDYLNKGIEYKNDWTTSTRYKVNDVVLWGATLYICTNAHTSVATNDDSLLGTLQADIANWDRFVPGLEFENTWSATAKYQQGDFVTYGGNQYVANTNNTGQFPSTSEEWDLVTSGFNLRGDWGGDSTNQDYRIGDVVRLGGYTYLCTADHQGYRPPNTTYWARLNQGIEWKDTWTTATLYDAGDAVRYGLISYVCILAHTSDTAKRPDNDSLGTYWKNLASGAEESALTTQGDILYYSGSGPARLPIGDEGQVLSVASTGIPEWKDFATTPDVYYVATNGVNNAFPTNGGTLDRPWKSIRYACEEIEKGPRNPNAVYLLEVNRMFIAYETAKWAKRQIITQTSPFFIGFSFDEAKFQRIAGFALDALILDLRRGGNVETRRAAKAMQDNVSGDWFETGSETQNVAALNFVISLAEDVLDSATPSADYQALDGVSAGDRYLQIKDTTKTEESGALAEITAGMSIVTNAVTLGNGYTLPAEIKLSKVVFVKTGTYKEVLPIRVPERVAVVGDELRSTRVEPAGQQTQSSDTTYSLAGILHMKSILDDIIEGNAITRQTGNTLTQDVSKPLSTAGVSTIVTDLAQELYDKIDFEVNGASGDSSAPAFRGNNGYVDDQNKIAGVRLLMLNKAFIARDVTKYINANYPSYSFNEATCESDVGHYIDAFIYDLWHSVSQGSNYATLYAGLYYGNSVNGSILENMYLLRDGTGVRNQTVAGLTGTLPSANSYGTKRPTAGAYCSLDPGWGIDDERVWIQNRSPYVQGVTTFGTACVGLKVDGDLHNGGNDSIVANDFTQILSDGIGAWITNLGRAELVSVFSYYGHIGYLAENGGKIRGTNGNCSYGDFGAVSEGIDGSEVPNTGGVNNRKLEAQVGRALTDGSEIIHLEYTNAGNNYTSSTYTISGAGYGASVANGNYVNGGVFEVRLRNPDDGSTYFAEDQNNDGLVNDPDTLGGRNYSSSENTAQGGNTTTITLSNTETANSTKYVGMRIVITAGVGAGQYGVITSYNPGTKVANVAKESDNTAGWDNFHHSNSVAATLDATTTYSIEPRVQVTNQNGGSGLVVRAQVSSGRITQFFIVNPGSGYTAGNPPELTITDPSETLTVPHEVRVGDGVLAQPTWTARGVDFETAGATISGDGYADIFQEEQFLNVQGMLEVPIEGANLQLQGDDRYFKVVFVRELQGSAGNYTANLQVSPNLGVETAPAHGTNITIRRRYSQVRLTGHDFLDIGTGNAVETNYPNTPQYEPDAGDEVNEFGGGRVFYTSTDQDGNFRVGRLFNVEQSTGSASLNTSAFSLAGLQELSLGAVGLGQGGAVINEFSTDGTMSANSDNIVPTQRAIITYINAQIGGGSSSLNVNAVTAGKINITGNTISTTDNSPITVTTGMNFNGGVDGAPVAFGYFLTSKT